MTKICSGCLIPKEEEEFNLKYKKTGKRQVRCRECTRKQVKSHYKNNRQYYLDKTHKRNKEVRSRNREFIFHYLLRHPCVDCGEDDIIVLQFDHQRDKKFSVVTLMGFGSIEQLLKEIEKCQVRCANCHVRRTSKQFNFYKEALLAQQTERSSSEREVGGANPLQGTNKTY